MSNKAHIFIERLEYFQNTTIGKLYLNESYFCWTLEDALRAYGVKVYGHTAIPAGKYKGTLSYSSRFKRIMPMIYTEDNKYELINGGISFKGVRLHGGNTHVNSHGCPLVAYERPSKEKIYRTAEYDLVAELKKYDEEFIVDITNNLE